MIKTFDITLEEQKPVDPQNSFAIYRGDNVQFNFTFLKNGEALEIPSGTILRVFAKKIEKNGIVDVNENPVFAGEWTDSTSATFNSSLTAGDAGMYLMSVMLVSSDDNLITSQAIYFEIKENGYAGRYQPSADYRDEVLNAKQDSIKARNEAEDFVQQASEYAYTAETSASEASTSESNAFNFAEDSRMYSESAITAGSNALQYSQQAEDFKEQAKDFRDETLIARDEAVLAKDTAVEISDPEGWRVNTRSMINALQQTKSNIGEFWFNGGALTTTNKMPLNTPFSCVWTMAMTQDEFVQHKTNSPGLIGAENYFGNPTTYQGWSICRKISSYTDIAFGASGIDTTNGYTYNNVKILNYLDGNTHVWAVVYNGNAISLYVDNKLLSSITATFNVSQSRIPLQIGQFTVVSNQSDGVWGRFSRIKYFNFDMSSDDAPYTIADYIAGKDESPLLQGGQPVFDWKRVPTTATLVGNKLSFETSTTSQSYVYPLGETTQLKRGKTYILKGVSNVITGFYAEKTSNTNTCNVSWQTINKTTSAVSTGSATNFYNPRLPFVNGEDVEFTIVFTPLVDGMIIYTYFPVGTIGYFEFYSVEQVGALLSLEDYTFNGKIADVSGNNNDATITGDVVGTKDKSIEKMYQAFASKIGNLTE